MSPLSNEWCLDLLGDQEEGENDGSLDLSPRFLSFAMFLIICRAFERFRDLRLTKICKTGNHSLGQILWEFKRCLNKEDLDQHLMITLRNKRMK